MFFQIDEDLTARINMADAKLSFMEKGRIYTPQWMAPEGKNQLLTLHEGQEAFLVKGYVSTRQLRVACPRWTRRTSSPPREAGKF